MTGLGLAVVDLVLAALAGEPGLADAAVVVHAVHALTAVGARVRGAVVKVDVAQLPRPPRLAEAPGGRREGDPCEVGRGPPDRQSHLLVSEEFVHAVSVDALIVLAEVHLELAPLAGEAHGALAAEVVHEVGAVGAKEAG